MFDIKKFNTTIKHIRLSDLYFQYYPDTFLAEFFTGDTIGEKLSLENTPHYAFAAFCEKKGKKACKEYHNERYIQLMLAWGRDDKHNQWKSKRFFDTFNSIKSKGFQGMITVVRKPVYEDHISDRHGFEIYHGHHRAAICYFLGHKKIKCEFVEN
jgi:hypothetical protein